MLVHRPPQSGHRGPWLLAALVLGPGVAHQTVAEGDELLATKTRHHVDEHTLWGRDTDPEGLHDLARRGARPVMGDVDVGIESHMTGQSADVQTCVPCRPRWQRQSVEPGCGVMTDPQHA
ncbi:hypothetical protein BCY76_012965 [Nesterenkonia sp. PF2B19]|nr:hypothetical protein BCY76_012965 [Nesterenkonia sp. PF2B19]